MNVHVDIMSVAGLIAAAGWLGVCLIVWLYVKFCLWLEKIISRRNNKTKEEEE